MEECLPDTIKFIEVIEAFQDNAFVVQELLSLALHLDYHDEAGRSAMSSFLRELEFFKNLMNERTHGY